MASHTLNLHSSGAENASGAGAAQGVARVGTAVLFVHVSAVTGTLPKMTPRLEDSTDGTNFATVRTYTPEITAPGTYRLEIGNELGTHARLAWTISGTLPSFTFSAQLAVSPIA